MALSAFDDKAIVPTGRALEEVLGRGAKAWVRLKEEMQAAYGPLSEDWTFAGKAYGWSLRLKQKSGPKRAVIYMSPGKGQFLASFALGEKACRAAHDCSLPSWVLEVIDAAPKYPEGRAVRIPVKSQTDVEAVCRVAECKMGS